MLVCLPTFVWSLGIYVGKHTRHGSYGQLGTWLGSPTLLSHLDYLEGVPQPYLGTKTNRWNWCRIFSINSNELITHLETISTHPQSYDPITYFRNQTSTLLVVFKVLFLFYLYLVLGKGSKLDHIFQFGRFNQLDDPFLNLQCIGGGSVEPLNSYDSITIAGWRGSKSSHEDSEAIRTFLQVGLQSARSS